LRVRSPAGGAPDNGDVPGRIDWLRRRVGAMKALPVMAVDAAIAALCYVATIALPVKAAAAAGPSLFALAALASLPLVWRRRYPVTVTALVGAGTLGLAMSGALYDIPVPYGQLVATYTFAWLASPLWRLVCMSATAAGTVLAVLILLGQGPATLASASVPFVVTYALGTSTRARRDRITMLEERAGRLAEEQHAAASRERARIAREIHDIVAHSVSIMVVQAEAGLVIRDDPDKARATLDTISATGREALTQLGRALGVLRGDPASRQPAPGLDDLPRLVEYAQLAGLEASLTNSGHPRPVPADLGAAIYRLVQEALTNTIKHAEAQAVSVRLDWQEKALHVEIDDDGRGPAPPAPTAGYGLIGMRERVRAFGGQLQTGAGDGGTGFRVKARLPLDAATVEIGHVDV